MDELKQIFKNEIDPDVIDSNKTKKQQKGFTTKGVKGLTLIDKNLIQIYEMNSNIEYTMDYLQFLNIVNVMGFNETKLELGLAKLHASYFLILDFDTKKIMIYDNIQQVKFVGQDFTTAKQLHTNKEEDEEYYNAEIYSEWYKEITKN